MARGHYQEELVPDVLKLMMTPGGRVTLVTQGLSARHGWHGIIIRATRYQNGPCHSGAVCKARMSRGRRGGEGVLPH